VSHMHFVHVRYVLCPPKPAPTVPMAEGADHEPSARRATTTPEPNRAVPRKPALKTERIARPYAWLDAHALTLALSSHLCISQNLRRDDLVGAERLLGVDKRRQYFSRLSAFACFTCQSTSSSCRGTLTTHRRGQRVVEAEPHVCVCRGCLRVVG
jgi:hypothetical protein